MISIPFRRFILGGAVFLCVWAVLFAWRMSQTPAQTFHDDPSEYNGAAVHLLTSGAYTIDGITPFYKREPGMSVFLAGIYAVFGMENRAAIFVIQLLLYLSAVALFLRECARLYSRRVLYTGFLLLLFLPSVFHVLLTAYRESLALSLLLLLSACLLRMRTERNWRVTVAAGLLLGALILTYIPMLLFPVFLLPVLYVWRIPWRHGSVMMLIAYLMVLPWGLRNMSVTGHACLTGCERTAWVWQVRGQQAEHLRGMESLLCLRSEYITRSWEGRSPYCQFSAIVGRIWGDQPLTLEENLRRAKEGQGMALRNFPRYVLLSVVEMMELYMPFVDGWGRIYNICASVGSFLLYVGLCCYVFLRRKDVVSEALFLAFIAYVTLLHGFTDATPRYLMPVIFCFCMLAAIGFDAVLTFRKKSAA